MRVRRTMLTPLVLVLLLALVGAPAALAQSRIDDGTHVPSGPPFAETARMNLLAFTDALHELTPGVPVEYYQQRLRVLRDQIGTLSVPDLEVILTALQGVPNWCCAIDEMRSCGAMLAAAPARDGPVVCNGIRQDAEIRHALLDAWNSAEVAALIADGRCHSAPDGDGHLGNGRLCPGAFVLKGLAWAARFAYEQSTFCHQEVHARLLADLVERLTGDAPLAQTLDEVRTLLRAVLATSSDATGAVIPAPAGAATLSHTPRLAAAAPNPATGEISFEVLLPETAPVRLRVYDVAGTLVDVVADATLPAGRHVLAWDPARARGARPAPGVYFVQLDAGGRHDTRRVVLSR